ncbi:ABC transporter ATP-binding protein [Streptomyces jeddahensis]|uniref:Oligopeptide transport ATP-binding protein OppD n=1 Tax=Streptomyces jeddahensis TaxID=1716141 RepID=A0A177HK18_9ACTN|nr:ABC transporter ATP-binding protein [Streptomyces jeddahensis]OAH10538.1 oligopeptide transport ATP-binding protein OppD [Streptomyces jeddahensis]
MHPADPLLSVRGLRIAFGPLEAVRGLSFDVGDGEVLALVGESGAGKSLTARALLGMLPREATAAGSVRLRGEAAELVGARRPVYARLWGRRIALVPQDALSALSPVHPVGDQLAAAVRSVRGVSRSQARARAVAALEQVGIADAGRRARAYPHEFSGGMRQRAVIAMAMINEPELVVADEPTTALDPDTQRHVLELLARRREETGASLVLVTHDLAAVEEHADRMLVMYAGRAAESGPVDEVFARPRAPYTAGLLASLPPDAPLPAGGRSRRLPAIAGAPPTLAELPAGCAFAPRCPLAERAEQARAEGAERAERAERAEQAEGAELARRAEPAGDDRCRTELPEPQRLGDGRREVACHRWSELPDRPAELFLEHV